MHRLRFERNLQMALKGFVILRHGNVVQREEAVFPLKSVKILKDVRTADLSCAIRTEVIEDDGILRLNGGRGFSVRQNDGRHYELVRYASIIALLHRFRSAACSQSLAISQRRIRLFHALKAIITIHGIVTAHDRRDPADAQLLQLCVDLLHIPLSARGRNVAAVHKAVNKDLCEPVILCELDERIEMRQMAMHAAIRTQSHEVQRRIMLLAVLDCSKERGILKELAVVNRFRDAGKLLIHDAPGADVQMPHLGIPHLPRGQAHIHAARLQQGMRVAVPQRLDIRNAVGLDGVALFFLAIAKAVKDEQSCDRFHQ